MSRTHRPASDRRGIPKDTCRSWRTGVRRSQHEPAVRGSARAGGARRPPRAARAPAPTLPTTTDRGKVESAALPNPAPRLAPMPSTASLSTLGLDEDSLDELCQISAGLTGKELDSWLRDLGVTKVGARASLRGLLAERNAHRTPTAPSPSDAHVDGSPPSARYSTPPRLQHRGSGSASHHPKPVEALRTAPLAPRPAPTARCLAHSHAGPRARTAHAPAPTRPRESRPLCGWPPAFASPDQRCPLPASRCAHLASLVWQAATSHHKPLNGCRWGVNRSGGDGTRLRRHERARRAREGCQRRTYSLSRCEVCAGAAGPPREEIPAKRDVGAA